MELVELTTPPLEALPLAAFKAHLQLGSGFSDENLQDVVLEAYLRASLAAIEARTGKALLERELEWHIGRWTETRRQPLPIAPVSAFLGVAIITAVGDVEARDLADFVLERDAHRPQLRALQGGLPAIPDGGTVALRFLAGFGAAWGDVPSDLQQAVLLLAAHFYEHRHEAAGSTSSMPFGVVSLLAPYRNVRLFGARS